MREKSPEVHPATPRRVMLGVGSTILAGSADRVFGGQAHMASRRAMVAPMRPAAWMMVGGVLASHGCMLLSQTRRPLTPMTLRSEPRTVPIGVTRRN